MSHSFELSCRSSHSSEKISADPTTMSRPLPTVDSHAAATGQSTGYEVEPDERRVNDGGSTLSVVPLGCTKAIDVLMFSADEPNCCAMPF
mmetsp:Transcript_12047/g.19888  ORF Transcript_12047/g.19888 Transcript_12047/m.19888 type:complete len:90 (-) Transcript_12047:382-651(-)